MRFNPILKFKIQIKQPLNLKTKFLLKVALVLFRTLYSRKHHSKSKLMFKLSQFLKTILKMVFRIPVMLSWELIKGTTINNYLTLHRYQVSSANLMKTVSTSLNIKWMKSRPMYPSTCILVMAKQNTKECNTMMNLPTCQVSIFIIQQLSDNSSTIAHFRINLRITRFLTM